MNANGYRNNAQRNRRNISIIMKDDSGAEVKGHHNGVNRIQCDVFEKKLYSAGRDGVIRSWNLANLPHKNPAGHAMEHHTDWVNDIVLCMNNRNVVSASSDCTVKVWNPSRGFCLSTLRTHKDYVKALAYAKDREYVASAGFDKQVFLWDVRKLLQLTSTNNTINTQNLSGAKNSIYSLAMNPSGSVCLAGGSEMVVSVWDPRTLNLAMRLKGHTENIKALCISDDGTKFLSGSSDCTVRLWSLGEQKCIETYRCHQDSVWALKADPHFTRFYSGGRDNMVYETSLVEEVNGNSRLIAEESNPILDLQFGDIEMKSLWVATTSSSINKWKISETEGGSKEPDSPNKNRSISLEGNPAIIKYHVLNNKRFILTEDTKGVISKWDVLTCKKVAILSKNGNLEEEVKKHQYFIFVPSWFSVDLKTGCLCIHLEEQECMQSWVSASDPSGATLKRRINDGAPEPDKVHLATLLLRALLEKWPDTFRQEEIVDQMTDQVIKHYIRKGNDYFSVSDLTTFIVSETSTGKSIARFNVTNCGHELEANNLREFLPDWVIELVTAAQSPKFHKIAFFLIPHPNCTWKGYNGKRDRLSANDLLPARKILEHVYEKMIKPDYPSVASQAAANSGYATADQNLGNGAISQEELNAGVDLLELYCNDYLIDLTLDLRTIKHYIWKGNSGDLCLHFKHKEANYVSKK